jgi:membrane protease YdiL (CAAX protease family)
LVVFFQAASEELVFRGYLPQQLAARGDSPLVWGFLPSFVFRLACIR